MIEVVMTKVDLNLSFEALFQAMVTKHGLTTFIEASAACIETQVADRHLNRTHRNLEQWRMNHGNQVFKKKPELQRRRKRIKELGSSLGVFRREGKKLVRLVKPYERELGTEE